VNAFTMGGIVRDAGLTDDVCEKQAPRRAADAAAE
jgi:hypothetical protein